MNSKKLDKRNLALRREIVTSLEYSIREMKSLLELAKNGESIYPSIFYGSTMNDLPAKIRVLLNQERLAADMKFEEESA